MKEQWRNIDFASNYEVSNTGFVRNKSTKHVLKGRETKNGYLQVSLKIDKKNKFVNQYVHRLVASFWLDNIDNKDQVNHIDGNKKNNNVSNLEWVTAAENLDHKINILNKKSTDNKKVGMFTKQN